MILNLSAVPGVVKPRFIGSPLPLRRCHLLFLESKVRKAGLERGGYERRGTRRDGRWRGTFPVRRRTPGLDESQEATENDKGYKKERSNLIEISLRCCNFAINR